MIKASFGPGCEGTGASSRLMDGAGRWSPGTTSVPRTSLRLEGGRPRQPEAHRDRLRASLRALGDAGAWLDQALEQSWAWARAQAGNAPLLALRILADPATGTVHVRLEEVPEAPLPYTLLPMPHPLGTERENPLAPHKGCLGPWNRWVLAAARQAGAEDALLHWGDATVAETAIAVVGCLAGKRLLLPPAAGRVRSIAELWDLPRWADERGWEVALAPLPLQEALQGQLWCFNALRGLWPASIFDSRFSISDAPPGPGSRLEQSKTENRKSKIQLR